ncbi:8-oxo-dGTP pyrophosphatase MutT (NUDIX family) [Bacillus pakistanensis]|uniref:8-oxo-dGTP pyrophosphatase MutT (NUDIX family) n=1 Tax=Rossellomorea pakistanensis TaxID=992288 RepID=A0ABS2NIU5_9BACI|nr:NUDIX hydrolase [Bacillus pakistanensis]MBM7587725.1 8-oxo-dGTP pyrophosphatase MutT (NUDIX family) [Bacillus pakistanensis]
MGYIEDLRKLVGHRPLIFAGAVAVLVDPAGKILLQQRKHPRGTWGIPGGLMELAESTEDVAKREVFEETGLIIDDLTLINVYSGPEHFIKAANGDEFYVVTTAYYTKKYDGEIKVDPIESIKFEFFSPNELPENMVKSHKDILNEFLEKHYTIE